ncbi:MAG: chemotaxis protein CheW [Xenococcaceae cyanobacterium MO_188.B29]|nr:chemotaxis protein CheW [Xenococcaceae cyanobacterium MO_188.B29]
MAIFSTLRSRRSAAISTETTEQMITFSLRQEWFALPILAVQKVIPLGKVYGDPKGTGVSITTHEDKEIIVVDVAKFIFQDFPSSDLVSTEINTDTSEISFLDWEQQRYLIIININQQTQDLLGLPIDSQPSMRRVTKSNFKKLPQAYLKKGNINCVSQEIIDLPEHPPIFLLAPQSLAQAYNI